MKISYNWLQDLIEKKLPQPKEVADLLTMHSFEAELIGKIGQDYLLDVDVLPNRAHDCLSHLGIAREIAAIKNSKLKIPNYDQRIKNTRLCTKEFVKVEVKNSQLCPRYTARLVLDVNVGPSPQWIQERLKICGLRPISNIVDITNYVMLETGQPLHAFDADKLPGGVQKAIIVRRAKKGEKIISLDNERYDLDENILVIADDKKPIAIAGIKGGKGPEIDKQTKRVIIEAANFSPSIIRSGSRQIKLKTDASWRFEHGLDPNLTLEAINQAAYLMQEIAGGQAADGLVDVYPNRVRQKKIRLSFDRVKNLLGVDISIREIKSILNRLGFEVASSRISKEASLEVVVPTRRIDMVLAEDLIEEIGRLYGYEKIPGQLPSATLIPSEINQNLVYQHKVRDVLTGLGLSEVYNYSFVSEKDVNIFQLAADELIGLTNPVSQEQKYLRPNLMINLLKNGRENKKYFKQVGLFEMGKVFAFRQGKNQQTLEQNRLAGILAIEDESGESGFYRLKGITEALLQRLRISDVWYDDVVSEQSSDDYQRTYQAGRRAEIKVGNDLVGWLGEINSQILKDFDLKARVAGFELDFEKIVQLANEERVYLPPSKYPAVVRDIALLVDRGTKVIEVLNLINAAGGPLIADIDLFDMYEGENIPDDKKSLAFHIIFQANDHTLTDKEVNQLQAKIIQTLEQEGGWEVRR